MSTYYYADSANQPVGPLALSEIQGLAQRGTIQPNTHVLEQGTATWRTWAEFQAQLGLASAGGAPSVQTASFCPKCGTGLPAGALNCPKCGASTAPADYAALVKTASTDAWRAFKTFALDPVGGLSAAFDGLGPARALGAGLFFDLAFAICGVVLVYGILPAWSRPGVGGFLKIFALCVVPPVSFFAAHFAARKIFRGIGGTGHDVFVTGASLLPWAAVALLGRLLGMANIEITETAGVFAACWMTLMLFAGLTKICRLTERAATLAIPVIILAAGWLSKILYGSLFQSFTPPN